MSDRFLGLTMLGLVTLIGVAAEVAVIQRGDPALAVVAPVTFVGLLGYFAWLFFPEAKAFFWLRWLKAARLLRFGDWEAVDRSATELIIPLGRRIQSELRARFRRDVRQSGARLNIAVWLLDRTDPSWPAKEVGFLSEQVREQVAKPDGMFLPLLTLLDRAGPDWTASPDVNSDPLVNALMAFLAPFHTRRSEPEPFTVKDETRWYGPHAGGVMSASASPRLDKSESALLGELTGRLGLLERLIQNGRQRPAGSVLRELVTWPDLALPGVLGTYLDVWFSEKDDRREQQHAVRGVKKVISSAAVRRAARERLAMQ